MQHAAERSKAYKARWLMHDGPEAVSKARAGLAEPSHSRQSLGLLTWQTRQRTGEKMMSAMPSHLCSASVRLYRPSDQPGMSKTGGQDCLYLEAVQALHALAHGPVAYREDVRASQHKHGEHVHTL